MDTPRGRLRLDPEQLFPIQLDRLWDHEVAALASWTTPLDARRPLEAHDDLDLPKVFLAARAAFGPSSKQFDDYKSTFQFPLLLSDAQAARDERSPRYLAILRDFNGLVDVSYRRVENEKPCRSVAGTYRVPVEGELDAAQLRGLTEHLIGYLCDRAAALTPSAEPFVHVVPNVGLVYGLRNGDVFEREFATTEERDAFVAPLRAELSHAEHERDRAAVSALIRRIANHHRESSPWARAPG